MRTLHWNRDGRSAKAYTAERIARACCLAVLAMSTACAELTSLEQDAPSRVLANDLIAPENAQLLVTSAISDYECALASYIVTTGLVGDELIDAQLAQVGWDY